MQSFNKIFLSFLLNFLKSILLDEKNLNNIYNNHAEECDKGSFKMLEKEL